jgi:hypothetical protein
VRRVALCGVVGASIACCAVLVPVGVLSAAAAGTWSASTVAPPASDVSLDPNLVSLSCTSTLCAGGGSVDVGYGDSLGLLATESSGSWTDSTAPLPSGVDAFPEATVAWASCVASSCVAIGSYKTSGGATEGVLDTWSAGSWTASQAPLPSGASTGSTQLVQPTQVWCAAAGSCVATSLYVTSGDLQADMLLTETSGSWSAVQTPLPSSGGTEASASAVTCSSASSCLAVGTYADLSGNTQGLILADSSGTWTAAKAPLPANAGSNPEDDLDAVSCASTGACVATGNYQDSSGNTQGLLLYESGSTWTASEASLPGDAQSNPTVKLPAAACAASASCLVVGSYYSSTGTGALVVSESAGTWTASEITALPSGGETSTGTLDAVSCPASASCLAGGVYQDAHGQEGLLLTESSGTWSARESPYPTGAASVQSAGSTRCPVPRRRAAPPSAPTTTRRPIRRASS